jgi:nucleoid-associated protein YgaU
VQGLAANSGKGDDWQSIAAANNIENPRRLQPGQLIDMTPPSVRVR